MSSNDEANGMMNEAEGVSADAGEAVGGEVSNAPPELVEQGCEAIEDSSPVAVSQNKIDRVFARLRSEGKRALMPFVCADHPSPRTTGAIIEAVAAAGASVIEVGIPFSDPIADGPVIAAAMHEALLAGSSPRGIFEAVRSVRDRVDAGLVAMVSVSIVRRIGEGGFIEQAAAAGFDGFIFPDCPLDEASDLSKRAADAGLTSTLLISTTTSAERAERIAKACTGFVYLVTRAGITGEQADAPDIGGRVARLREWTDLPIACGFGISTAEHVRAVVKHADAAIVGSALVRRVSEAAANGGDVAAAAGGFVRELAGGLEP